MRAKIVLAAAAAVAVGTAPASARQATDTSSKTVYADCVDAVTGERQGTFTWDGPTASWPPNHKSKSAVVSLTDDDAEPAADEASLEVAGMHDEATYEDNVATSELNGSGRTDPATDSSGGAAVGTPTASVPVSWRSERSGRGDGRTYTFTATGTTDGGLGACKPVTFTVTVPHDQGGGTKPATGKRKKRAARR